MNNSINMLCGKFYICKNYGNVIYSTKESIHNCCGKELIEEEIIEKDIINCELIENEYYITINNEMTKDNYISFIAYITSDRCEIVKLYPEQNAETRFFKRGKGLIYAYSSKEGLFKKEI